MIRRAGTTGPPDYVGVGTRRAGAEWWHALLIEHPDVEWRPRSRRSLSFFGEFCRTAMTQEDAAAYHRRFRRRPGRIVGEWSDAYMYEPWTPPLLARAAPDAKVLVIVSDPVERFRRRLRFERLRGRRDEVGYRTPDALLRGLYATQLRNLWNYFDRERTLVLQYERCALDPLGEYRRTLRFLGLREDFRPRTGLGRRVRVAREQALRRATRGALWPDIEAALRAELDPEIRDLEALVPEIDASLWG